MQAGFITRFYHFLNSLRTHSMQPQSPESESGLWPLIFDTSFPYSHNIPISFHCKLSNKSKITLVLYNFCKCTLRAEGRIIFQTFVLRLGARKFWGLGVSRHTKAVQRLWKCYFLLHEFPSAIALETTSNDKEAPQTQRNKIKEFILLGLQLEKPALLSNRWDTPFPCLVLFKSPLARQFPQVCTWYGQ